MYELRDEAMDGTVHAQWHSMMNMVDKGDFVGAMWGAVDRSPWYQRRLDNHSRRHRGLRRGVWPPPFASRAWEVIMFHDLAKPDVNDLQNLP